MLQKNSDDYYTPPTSWLYPVCYVTCKTWRMKPVQHNSTFPAGANCTFGADAAVPQFSYLLALLFGVPATAIILVTVFGNFLVLCFKAKVGKRQTMLLIWNLGLADFLVGLIVLPLGVSYVIGRKWPFGRLLCRIWVSCDVIFCTASIVTLCIISVDRYIGVTRPLRYKLIVTKTRVMVAIVAIWIFSICILLGTIRYETDECYNPNICHAGNELEYVVHSVVFAFFMPTLVTLGLYWKIFKIAKTRERGLAQGLIIAMGENFLKDCFAVPLRIHCGKDTVTQQQQVIRMHKRVAKTLGVVVSAFLLCWLPFFSLYVIGYQCGGCIPSLVLDITTWLGYCNSMINPVIYAFTVDEFKKTLDTLLCSFWRKHPRRPSAQSALDDYRVAAGQVAAGCTSKTPILARGRAATTTMRPPISPIPRSNRAYSLVPAATAVDDRHNASLLTPSSARRNTDSKSPQRRSFRNRYATMEAVRQSPSPATSPQPSKQRSWKKKQRGGSRRSTRSQNEDSKNTSVLENGTATNSDIQLDLNDFSPNSNVDEQLWSAKLYCTLISPQTTGL